MALCAGQEKRVVVETVIYEIVLTCPRCPACSHWENSTAKISGPTRFYALHCEEFPTVLNRNSSGGGRFGEQRRRRFRAAVSANCDREIAERVPVLHSACAGHGQ